MYAHEAALTQFFSARLAGYKMIRQWHITDAIPRTPSGKILRRTLKEQIDTMTDVFIVGGARTPMTEYVGALKDVSAIELGAIASRGAFQKTGVKPEWIDHVVFGNVLQTSADAIYGARHVALKAACRSRCRR